MKQKTGMRIEWVAALILYIVIYIIYGRSNQSLTLIASAFVVFLIYVLFRRGVFSFHFDGFYMYILVFGAFCYLSALWAEKSSLAIRKGNTLVLVFLLTFVLGLIFKDRINLSSLLKMIMWGNYCILGYAVLRYGWGTFIDALQSGIRISNEFLNANTLGMCAAYAVIINFYLLLYERRRISDLLIIPAIFVIAISGSRKSLVLIIAGVVGVFIFKSLKRGQFLKSLLRILLVIIIALLVVILLSRLSMFRLVFDRTLSLINLLIGGGSGDNSAWLRLQYYKLGWQLFKQNPICGIGIDNARIYTSAIYGYDHYLHCNYVELMACGGLIGSVIYYSIYVYIIYIMIKFRSFRNGEWDICMILILAKLGMDFGLVSYETIGSYVYLLLFWLEAQKLKKAGKVNIEAHLNNVDKSIEKGAV